jgi:hypothetical protein
MRTGQHIHIRKTRLYESGDRMAKEFMQSVATSLLNNTEVMNYCNSVKITRVTSGFECGSCCCVSEMAFCSLLCVGLNSELLTDCKNC